MCGKSENSFPLHAAPPEAGRHSVDMAGVEMRFLHPCLTGASWRKLFSTNQPRSPGVSLQWLHSGAPYPPADCVAFLTGSLGPPSRHSLCEAERIFSPLLSQGAHRPHHLAVATLPG